MENAFYILVKVVFQHQIFTSFLWVFRAISVLTYNRICCWWDQKHQNQTWRLGWTKVGQVQCVHSVHQVPSLQTMRSSSSLSSTSNTSSLVSSSFSSVNSSSDLLLKRVKNWGNVGQWTNLDLRQFTCCYLVKSYRCDVFDHQLWTAAVDILQVTGHPQSSCSATVVRYEPKHQESLL